MRRQTLENLGVIVLKVVIVLTIVFCSLLWVLDNPSINQVTILKV